MSRMTSPHSLRVTQVAPGLWRWISPPSPCARGPISSVYCETTSAIVLVDPVLPDPASPEHERFFRALDSDVARLGLPVIVLTTCDDHARDAPRLSRRYSTRAHETTLSVGVVPLDVDVERAIWLPSHGALVLGHAGEESARAALRGVDPGARIRQMLWTHRV